MHLLRFFAKIQFSENYRFGYKKASKIEIFLEPKSMDQNLSNDVFGSVIRVLDQILHPLEVWSIWDFWRKI